jgi:hypothetical protein
VVVLTDAKKTNEYAGFKASRPADPCQFLQNDAGTCGTIDTRLTQPRSRSLRSDLTAERLREVLEYDPLTGVFRWRVARGAPVGGRVGVVAGSKHPRGYRYVCIDGVSHKEHRLVWLYATGAFPALNIDHRDGNRSNNRLSNLREATTSQNNANARRNRTNKSGFKGVSWHKAAGRWRAQITMNGRVVHLGHFKKPEEAHAVYVTAATKHFGAFACDGVRDE